MSKILVLQHVAHEPLGTLDPLLRRSGFRMRFVNFGREPEARPELHGYRGLIILGGPMNVDQTDRFPHLAHERDLAAEAIDRGLPVLGICLGAQLIARALGAPVTRSPRKEVGWHAVSPTGEGRKDPLFAHFGEAEHLFQWHEDTFEVPPGAVHLARSAACSNQAFRVGDCIYGFQFHMEVDEPMIERWLHVLAPDLADVEGGVERVRSDTKAHVARLRLLSERTFAGFLSQFPSRTRTRVLASR